MIRLGFGLDIEPYLLKISTKDMEIDMSRGRGLNCAFLSEDVPKCVIELLELSRRGFDAATSAANIDATAIAQWLETPLSSYLDPVYPAFRILMPAGMSGNRRTTPRKRIRSREVA